MDSNTESLATVERGRKVILNEAQHALEIGAKYPYDAPEGGFNGNGFAKGQDRFWENWPVLAARGVLADLCDRRGIKQGFENLDHSIRQEITYALAAIVRRAWLNSSGIQSREAMRFSHFSEVNVLRCTAEDGFHHELSSWSPAEWTNAVAGEAGEACNIAKKMLRHDKHIAGNFKPEDQDREVLRRRAMKELADTILYSDLAIQALGGSTGDEVRKRFNEKSQEIGSTILM